MSKNRNHLMMMLAAAVAGASPPLPTSTGLEIRISRERPDLTGLSRQQRRAFLRKQAKRGVR